MSTIHTTHHMIAPASFQADAGYGERTCSGCHACTCHAPEGKLAEPCVVRAGGEGR